MLKTEHGVGVGGQSKGRVAANDYEVAFRTMKHF